MLHSKLLERSPDRLHLQKLWVEEPTPQLFEDSSVSVHDTDEDAIGRFGSRGDPHAAIALREHPTRESIKSSESIVIASVRKLQTRSRRFRYGQFRCAGAGWFGEDASQQKHQG
jgi:hypothetical protein